MFKCRGDYFGAPELVALLLDAQYQAKVAVDPGQGLQPCEVADEDWQ